MAAAFLMAPAFSRSVDETAEAAFFAVLGYLAAGLVAHFGAQSGVSAALAGPLPAMGAALSLMSAGALLGQARRGAPSTVLEPRVVKGEEEAQAVIAAQKRRIAELSHELRTPLTHIIGFADAMRQRLFGPLQDKYGEYVELIHKSGQNLLDLTNRLLDLSRLEAGKFQLQREEFDLSLVADEVVRLSAEAAQAKAITLRLEQINLPLQVNADVAAMRQIFINLIANAIKFTPSGGEVRVRAYAHNDRLRIEVQDNGPGIPVAEKARLGAAFERGASGAAAEGYGLGLSLVRAFAEAHGGQLSFHDAPGGGALVRVEAPIFA
jgi:cell cycle sensor histidine kinase DivJ